MNRRAFLQIATTVAASATLQACAPIADRLPSAPAPLPNLQFNIHHLPFTILSRLTYGPRPTDLPTATEIGPHAWVEQQLDYANIPDQDAALRLRPYDLLHQTADQLDGQDPTDIIQQMQAATLLRRTYSTRQLYEIMVEFWTDHFNISMRKDDVWMLKPTDEREVIRKHALGNFRDLLHASAKSPAMLIYLDNQANVKDAPNENYAREVMELHSLGVDGGYTQQDVQELARCFTGWTVKENWWMGDFTFNPDTHDDNPKTVLGTHIAPNGIYEAEAVLDVLASHPSTAHHIATKLVRRFITDHPQRDEPGLVNAVARTFLQTDGDIKAVLKMVLHDGLIDRSAPLPRKFKRPAHFVVSALRLTHARTAAPTALLRAQAAMGQADYEWPTPDGPPDVADAWQRNLLPRWKFALSLMLGEFGRTQHNLETILNSDPSPLNTLSTLLLNQPYPNQHIATQLAATNAPPTAIAAGLIASPAFQWR